MYRTTIESPPVTMKKTTEDSKNSLTFRLMEGKSKKKKHFKQPLKMLPQKVSTNLKIHQLKRVFKAECLTPSSLEAPHVGSQLEGLQKV